MKLRLKSKFVLFSVLVVAGLTAGLQLGCSKAGVPDDKKLIAKIENEKWKSCGEASPKTVYDAYFKSDDFAERLILAGRVSSITEELERSRERFLNTGDLIEVFPLVYFYETSLALETGMKPAIVNKIEYMNLIIAGFDAYKHNREAYDSGDKAVVDRQWRDYFKSAEEAQTNGVGKWTPADGVEVLAAGINAHVLSDMPRAIRYVVSKSKVGAKGLAGDFDASTGFFADAEAQAKSDILKRFDTEEGAKEVNSNFGNGSEFVAFARKKAWEMGVGNGPLGVLAEQPHSEHDADSRKFFPKELMSRGICR